MFPVVQLGPAVLPVPGLALLAGLWGALWLSEKEARWLGLNPDDIYTLVFTGLVAALVGARLAYVARYWPVYVSDPWGILSPNTASLAPVEGGLIGLLVAGLYGARRKLPPRATLDALAPGLAFMAVALAVAHLASGDAFGAPTDLPWHIYLWGAYRHPAQVYELIAALAVLGVGWGTRARGPFTGFNFLLVVSLLAGSRVLLEAFRGDSLLLPGGWRVAQVVGLAVLAACLAGLRAGRPRTPTPDRAGPESV